MKLGISAYSLEKAINDNKKKNIKAIIPVHLYGMPAKMEEIELIANRYEIPIIEDAAEALGSKYKNKLCGTFGTMSILSFNGNKIITTSGGGALVSKVKIIQIWHVFMLRKQEIVHRIINIQKLDTIIE